MTTVARRIVATPARSASSAWEVIVTLLAPQADSEARNELLSIMGIACSLITDEAMKTAPIVVYGSGPRVRVYCLYDEDAIIGEDAKEDALSFNATENDWKMSLPCPADDLSWVKAALKKLSSRISARDMINTVEVDNIENNSTTNIITVDKEAFFRA